jgi:hypothetical protein
MINKLFILNIFTVTLVGSPGVENLLPEGRSKVDHAVGHFIIICEDTPIAKNFNQWVTEYFRQNFNEAGMNYLYGLIGEECVDISGDAAMVSEMTKIVSGGYWKARKSPSNVRFRVHRFLGFLESGTSKLDVIDFHEAFDSPEFRKDIDKSLDAFKSIVKGHVAGETPAFDNMGAKCLQLIGQVVTGPKDFMMSKVSDVLSLYTDLVEIYQTECIDRKDSVLRKTKTCELLPTLLMKTELKEAGVSSLVNKVKNLFSAGMWFLLTSQELSLYDYLQSVVSIAEETGEICPDKALAYTQAVTGGVKEVIRFVLEKNEGSSEVIGSASDECPSPPEKSVKIMVLFQCDLVGEMDDPCSPLETRAQLFSKAASTIKTFNDAKLP